MLRLSFLVLSLLFAIPSSSATILETATLGGSTTSGAAINGDSWFSARFSVDSLTRITRVGGHFFGNAFGADESLFAALVPLDSPSAFPADNPELNGAQRGLDLSGVIGHSVFIVPRFPTRSSDILTPLLAVISPGDYAVIFGSGLFGATGVAAIPGNNPTNTKPASFIRWATPRPNTSGWRNDGGGFVFDNLGFRFIAEGFAIPEPSSFRYCLLGYSQPFEKEIVAAIPTSPRSLGRGGSRRRAKSRLLQSGAVSPPANLFLQNAADLDPDAIKAKIPEYQMMVDARDLLAAPTITKNLRMLPHWPYRDPLSST